VDVAAGPKRGVGKNGAGAPFWDSDGTRCYGCYRKRGSRI